MICMAAEMLMVLGFILDFSTSRKCTHTHTHMHIHIHARPNDSRMLVALGDCYHTLGRLFEAKKVCDCGGSKG